MKHKFLKKSITFLLLAVFAFSAFCFAACGTCTEHKDSNSDGKCDVCGTAMSVECTTHVDANGDKKCDVCGKDMPSTECTTHVDANSDGKCDVCGETMLVECTTHVDANSDGKCDVCGKNMSIDCTTHVDANSDGKCDVCEKTMPIICTTHVDANADAKCDVCGAGITVNPAKTVSKIEILKNPDKVYFEVNDVFTVAGGIIKVTYADGTTQEVAMLSSSFTVAEPSMTAPGNKNINVRYGENLKCTFPIVVANKSFYVTYNLNYEGAPEPEVVAVVKGNKAQDKKPTRAGYTFQKWYAHIDYIYTYDFEQETQADAELFAFWKKDGAAYVDVTFDHGYFGDLYETYSYPVESGTAVRKPIVTPVRFGYVFNKWVNTAGTEYNFSSTVSAAITLKATWTKTISGRQTYMFEAEDTSLKGKIGPAFSGTVSEEAMIVRAPANRGCSNDRFVSYLYRNGNSLEFYIACDEDISDVTLYARLSAEYRDYTFNPSNYAIELNGVELNYNPIAFVGVPPPDDAASGLDCLTFKDYTIGINLTLKKGENLIRLVTKNTDSVTGTTFEAAAPIVDGIKIETTGVLIWNANRKLPMKSNY